MVASNKRRDKVRDKDSNPSICPIDAFFVPPLLDNQVLLVLIYYVDKTVVFRYAIDFSMVEDSPPAADGD
jgi:hypothetical protein